MRTRFIALFLLLAFLQPPLRAAAQCADWLPGPLDKGTGPVGADGWVLASVTWDPDGDGPLQPRLVVAGSFDNIDGVPARHIAYRDPATGEWNALGAGIAANVYALTVWNGQLVAGGGGDSDPGTVDNNLLYWNGTTWLTFNGGTSTGSVYALAVYNGDLYAGGSLVIYPTVAAPALNIARWNAGAGLWEEVASGTNGTVQALYPWAGYLYVGGSFSVAGGQPNANGFARWNGAWQLPGGSARSITDFSPGMSGDLLASGNFSNGGAGSSPGAGSWNGSSWTLYPTTTANGSFYRVVAYGGSVYAAGFFTSINSLPVIHVGRWTGSAWQDVVGGTDANVWALDTYNNELLAMGEFVHVSGAPMVANHIARWNGYEWGTFGGGTASDSKSYVGALVPFRGRLVAGGYFHQYTASGPTAHFVVGYSTAGAMSAFGTGMDGIVQALKSYTVSAVTGSTDLVAGGLFTVAGGVVCNHIARWNESNAAFPAPAWAPMGAGFNSSVYAIERHSGATYAAGDFTLSGGTALSHIARWNATSGLWEPLGSGMNGDVFALRSYNGQLYAGGAFTTAGGVATGHLAKWNGTSWSAVGSGGGLQGSVYALEVHNNLLVVGGDFPYPLSDGLCTWDGTAFGTLGPGAGNVGGVRSLCSTGSRLYVGGLFTQWNGVVASNVAYWDGANWNAMGGGAESFVLALRSFNGEIHVGGSFYTVDASALTTPKWARWTETGVPLFVTNPSSQNVAPGSTVTFNTALSPGYPGYTLQWYHDGLPLSDGPTGHGSTLSGAHAPQLVLSNADSHTDGGAYFAAVVDGCGSDSSLVATLSFDGFAAVGPGVLRTAFDAIGPNPSPGATRLSYSLARDARVQVRVLDVTGRLVRLADEGVQGAGRHAAAWDARTSDGTPAPAGLYFVGLEVDGARVGTRRLVIAR